MVRETIERLCAVEELTPSQMAGLLGRSVESLKNHYLNQMVRAGLLVPKYPAKRNHPQQAYRIKPASSS